MGYNQWWKTLENLIIELRKKDVSITPNIMTSLRSAKTMIGIYQSDPSCVETIPTIEMDLMNIESDLMTQAKEKVSQEFAEKWIIKLEQSRKETDTTSVPSTSFIRGLPRSDHWIRVQPSEKITKKHIIQLANETGLSIKKQEDDHLVVYGDKAKVKIFVKKIAGRIQRTSRK